LFAVVLAAAAALSVWQWRAAAPLDVNDPAVRGRPPFSGLGPVDITSSSGEPPWVVIGQWEYRSSEWADSDGELVAETAENRIQHGGFPTENPFEVTPVLREIPEIERRPITAMARLRAWLGAD
jgi:hypothetical protein